MIRFIDLTEEYWTDPEFGRPICAFLDTITDRFVENDCGQMTFTDYDDIAYAKYDDKRRLAMLVPPGFFDKNTGEATV